jgi:hypothetical protein
LLAWAAIAPPTNAATASLHGKLEIEDEINRRIRILLIEKTRGNPADALFAGKS